MNKLFIIISGDLPADIKMNHWRHSLWLKMKRFEIFSRLQRRQRPYRCPPASGMKHFKSIE